MVRALFVRCRGPRSPVRRVCRLPRSSSSTTPEVSVGVPAGMPMCSAGILLPSASAIASVSTRRVFGSTSRYSPTKYICIGPLGVSISMAMWRWPPTRTSMSALGIVAPMGPHQLAKCSASVHIDQIRSIGASNVRSIRTWLVSVIGQGPSCRAVAGRLGRIRRCDRTGGPRCAGTARPNRRPGRAGRGRSCMDGAGLVGLV